jgi:endonuclease/exonuclease/phosphatase family metal-dependent hydrolase
MSLNVLHGFPRFEHLPERLDLVAAEIHSQDADIVLLQEVPWTLGLGSGARYLAKRTGMNHLYLRANGNRWAILFEEGEAILSRYPLKDVAVSELEPQAGLFEHRAVLRASAVTPMGTLPVYVTHLTNGSADINRGQASALQRFVSESGGGLALVAGDLNAVEWSPQIQSLAEEWIDVFRAANPDLEGYTCCVEDVAADSTELLEKRIDYVFLVPGSAASVVGSQRVLHQPFQTEEGWLWASDHAGVFAEIELWP